MVQHQTACSLTPKKSPGLLTRSIDSNHFYTVNCLFPHSLRVLNRAQYEILSAVDGKTEISRLSDRFSLDEQSLTDYFTLLSQTEIVSLGEGFSLPAKPAAPDSLNFWVHATNKCNLSCGYCYISTLQTTGGMTDQVRKQFLHKLVHTVKARGVSNVKLRLAGGEPLTQFGKWKGFICEAKARLVELACTLDISFLTNLTILNDEIINFSKVHHLGFGVSLDGVAAYHDQDRVFRSGAGTFARVEQNLRKLLENEIRVSVNTVITNKNLAGLPRLTRYLIDLNIPFRYSIVKGEGIDPEHLGRQLTESYDMIEDAIAGGWQFSRLHQFCDLKPMELGFQTCASGFSGGAVYVDGSVNYCHVHFGDSSQKSFSIFDEELDLVDMIEQGEHAEVDRSQDCKVCKYQSVCTSGCPVYRVGGKDPQCSIYHKFIPRIYDLLAKERLKLLLDCKSI